MTSDPVKPEHAKQIDIDALEAIARPAAAGPWDAETAAIYVAAVDPQTVLALITELRQERAEADKWQRAALTMEAELRQERERAQNGSCWDEGPTLPTPDGCDPMPPRCELRAGHAGAHRSGRTEWMRNSSLRQVEKERDEARAELRKRTTP